MIYFARIQLVLLSARISLLAFAMRGTDRALCAIVWLSDSVLMAAGRVHRAVLAMLSHAHINAFAARTALRDHLATPDDDAPAGCLGDEVVGVILFLGAFIVIGFLSLEAILADTATLIVMGAR